MASPPVRIYTTDACGYCGRAKDLLERKGVAFEEVHFSRSDMQARQDLVALTGRYTVPQVLIGELPIGGWEDLKALDATGRLDALLEAGAPPNGAG